MGQEQLPARIADVTVVFQLMEALFPIEMGRDERCGSVLEGTDELTRPRGGYLA